MIGILQYDFNEAGEFVYTGSGHQFLVQLAGVGAAFALAFGGGLILFFIIKKTDDRF